MVQISIVTFGLQFYTYVAQGTILSIIKVKKKKHNVTFTIIYFIKYELY